MKKIWNSPDVTFVVWDNDAIVMSNATDDGEIGTSYDSIFGQSNGGTN